MEETAMLVFDGRCGFCRRCVRWGARRWSGVTPVASADLSERPAGLDADQLAASVWWIDRTGRYSGAAAVARALAASRPPWRQVGRLLKVAPVTKAVEPGYRLVARYRHRLPGSTDACRSGADGRGGRR